MKRLTLLAALVAGSMLAGGAALAQPSGSVPTPPQDPRWIFADANNHMVVHPARPRHGFRPLKPRRAGGLPAPLGRMIKRQPIEMTPHRADGGHQGPRTLREKRRFNGN